MHKAYVIIFGDGLCQMQRIANSTNLLIMTIEKSCIVRIDSWIFWQKNSCIAPATEF